MVDEISKNCWILVKLGIYGFLGFLITKLKLDFQKSINFLKICSPYWIRNLVFCKSDFRSMIGNPENLLKCIYL